MIANLLTLSALWVWLPIVLAVFAIRSPREAVAWSFVLAWLFLPGVSFDIPGLPDWTKMSATVTGLFLGVFFFDSGRLLALRPRWYDVPIVIWCLCPFVSSMTTNVGAYDGFSAVLDQLFAWGLPYILGRAYFSDEAGARLLTLAIAVGGLLYVPFCLVEIRFSPVFRAFVYGIYRWEGVRFGGYRPCVFLQSGLELGMWMTCATLAALCLWSSGAVKKLRGYSFGALTVGLTATTILCKSTGSLALLVVGLGTIGLARQTRSKWPAWLLLAIAPMYSITRTSNTWSGDQAVEIAGAIAGEERAESLKYRFDCETIHAAKALSRPFFGFSRNNQFFATSGDQRARTIDGYWIITLITSGIVGLTALNAMLLLPLFLTIRRYPARRWLDPEVAPVMALAVMLALFMVDNLANAMLNPIYAVMMGGITAMKATGGGSRSRRAEEALDEAWDLADRGDAGEAEGRFRHVLDWSSTAAGAGRESAEIRARALDGLARVLEGTGRDAEAVEALQGAVSLRLDLAIDAETPEAYRDLALAHEALARAWSAADRVDEAIRERRKALELWAALAASRPRDPEDRAGRVASLNDLAWLLAMDPDHPGPLLDEAVALAAESTGLDPANPAAWNTLGVARYRAGDWPGSVEALRRSIEVGAPGGTAFDHYFLSMACRRLGDLDHARAWFDRAVAWSDAHLPGHPRLEAFRSEAATLLVGPVERPPSLNAPRADPADHRRTADDVQV